MKTTKLSFSHDCFSSPDPMLLLNVSHDGLRVTNQDNLDVLSVKSAHFLKVTYSFISVNTHAIIQDFMLSQSV